MCKTMDGRPLTASPEVRCEVAPFFYLFFSLIFMKLTGYGFDPLLDLGSAM